MFIYSYIYIFIYLHIYIFICVYVRIFLSKPLQTIEHSLVDWAYLMGTQPATIGVLTIKDMGDIVAW